MKISKDAQRFAVQRGWTVSDISSRAVPRCQDADRSEEPQAVSQTRATDAEPLGQFAFGRKSITGLEAALPDHVANLADDLFGDQSGFVWSDHPKPAQTNCAVLVSSHRFQ